MIKLQTLDADKRPCKIQQNSPETHHRPRRNVKQTSNFSASPPGAPQVLKALLCVQSLVCHEQVQWSSPPIHLWWKETYGEQGWKTTPSKSYKSKTGYTESIMKLLPYEIKSIHLILPPTQRKYNQSNPFRGRILPITPRPSLPVAFQTLQKGCK